MSVICKNCGATNDRVSSTCPFCKSSMESPASSGGTGRATGGSRDVAIAGITRAYMEGKLDNAQQLIAVAIKERPELEEEVPFMLLEAKILLECEAPAARIKALLSKAYLKAPKSTEVTDYLEIVDAKEKLDFSSKRIGEEALEKVIRRSPRNAHAHFLLGAHHFWVNNDAEKAEHHLQQCVSSRPNLLRAWACLGALYKMTENEEMARRAFRRCLELETNPQRIDYFRSLLGEAA